MDNGIGFDSAFNEKILEPFQRLNSTSVEGSGLGLATCKTICDLHGWTLRCEAEVNAGATFVVGMTRSASMVPVAPAVERAEEQPLPE